MESQDLVLYASLTKMLYNELDARDFDFDLLDSREWDDILDARDIELMDLEARVGQFYKLKPGQKEEATDFVDEANLNGKLAIAAAPGDSAKTVMQNKDFHLDRQQPTNADGQHKVAVQYNKGSPSTVGQVAIHGNTDPSSKEVCFCHFYTL